tara:strand:- start:286 stop:792 length:507 start_codon:yes stop_codon:yes gene_type:complete
MSEKSQSTAFRPSKNRPQMTYIEPAVINSLIKRDKNFQKSLKAVLNSYSCLERYNKQHYRMKVEAEKHKLVENYICKFVVRRQVIINLTVKLVKKYWKEQPLKVEPNPKLIGKINRAMKSFWKNKKRPLISNYQRWLYTNYKGSDRFIYTKVDYDFYVDTGIEPYSYS